MKKDIHPQYKPVTFIFGEGDNELKLEIRSSYVSPKKSDEALYRCDADVRTHRAWNPDKSVFATDSTNVKVRAFEARFGKSRRLAAAQAQASTSASDN